MRWFNTVGVGALAVCGAIAFNIPAAQAQGSRETHVALGHEEPDIKFDGVALTDCIDFLRDISNLNIHVDWKALESVNINKDTPITLRLHDVTLRTALTMVLNEAGDGHLLTFYIDDNVIEITTDAEADRMLVTKVYPVGDLLMDIPNFTNAPNFELSSSGSSTTIGPNSNGAGASPSVPSSPLGSGSGSSEETTKKDRADQLVKLITTTIRPDIWRDNGGTASISMFNDSLVVTAPRSVQEAIGGPLD